MFLDYGYRSACCYAPIKLGKKKVGKTDVTLKIWICVNCKKRDVNIVEYSKTGPPKSTFSDLDTDEGPVIE